MQKRMFPIGLGILLGLMMSLVSCEQPSSATPDEGATQIEITNIPTTIGNGSEAMPYKVYVRLEATASGAIVAEGEAKVSNNKATVKLKADKGNYNMVVIISPQKADSYQDILVYEQEVTLNNETLHINKNDLLHKEEKRESLYDKVVSVDTEIGTPANPNTEQIEITNIPAKTGRGSNPDAASYKIYVQISSGTDASAGYVAKGAAMVNGKSTVTIEQLLDPQGKPWSGKGNYNIAITLSPQQAASHDDIQVHATMPVLSKKTESFDWASMIDLWKFGMEQQIKALYEGIVREAPAITTPAP